MSLFSRIRTFAHRNVVQPGMMFLYRRVYGMDIGDNVRISRGSRLDKTYPAGNPHRGVHGHHLGGGHPDA